MSEVSKGDVFIAGGTAKKFEVQSVSKGFATVKEVDQPEPDAKPEPEELEVRVQDLIDSDDWKGIE